MQYKWKRPLGGMLAPDEQIMKSACQHKITLLRARDISVEFAINKQLSIEAISNVSFCIGNGEALGLVGESGCGKSTLARTITQLQKVSNGTILFDDQDLTCCTVKQLRRIRPRIQMIFQDAVASLNPGRSIGASIAEPLRVMGGITRQERRQKARDMMRKVGLDPDLLFNRRPFELSGGQCQRVSIARALMTQPKLLICDEPVSSLDVSIQAQILNLLRTLKSSYGLTLLFISHDLAVVKNICDRVAVMYLGKLCEIATSDRLYHQPLHPYTQALLASIPEPVPDKVCNKVELKRSDFPSPMNPPSGCRFHTRCPFAKKKCINKDPEFIKTSPGSGVACHYPLQ